MPKLSASVMLEVWQFEICSERLIFIMCERFVTMLKTLVFDHFIARVRS